MTLNSSLAGAIETAGDERSEAARDPHDRQSGHSWNPARHVGGAARGRRRRERQRLCLEAEAPAGVYYVRVRCYATGTGSYTTHESGEASVPGTPDLVVEAPFVIATTRDSGKFFDLRASVRN